MHSETYALEREANFLRDIELRYNQFLADLDERRLEAQNVSEQPSISRIHEECAVLISRFRIANEERTNVNRIRSKISQLAFSSNKLRDELINRANFLEFQCKIVQENLDSIKVEDKRTTNSLQKLVQINVLNDAFYIWHSGPFATINNFRLGRLPTHQVDWTEINAAFGQAALAVTSIAYKANIQFYKYSILSFGSFAKILKNTESHITYNLYTEGTYSIFPKKNFNQAVEGFICCIQELGHHVVESDPTLQLPYVIEQEGGRIHGLPVGILAGDEEQWTMAMKYMLSDIKWIIAWAAKHLNCI